MFRKKWESDLVKVFLSFKNKHEVVLFLNAFLSPMEKEEFTKRWQIMKGLFEGETQREVKDEIAVSIATVTRAAREVKYGTGILHKLYKRVCPKE